MSSTVDFIVTFGVLFVIGIVVYTKIKKQRMEDTIMDIKSIFSASTSKVTEAAEVFPLSRPI